MYRMNVFENIGSDENSKVRKSCLYGEIKSCTLIFFVVQFLK